MLRPASRYHRHRTGRPTDRCATVERLAKRSMGTLRIDQGRTFPNLPDQRGSPSVTSWDRGNLRCVARPVTPLHCPFNLRFLYARWRKPWPACTCNGWYTPINLGSTCGCCVDWFYTAPAVELKNTNTARALIVENSTGRHVCPRSTVVAGELFFLLLPSSSGETRPAGSSTSCCTS